MGAHSKNRQPIPPDQRGTTPFRETSTAFSTMALRRFVESRRSSPREPPHEDVPHDRPDELRGAGLAVVRSLAPEAYMLLNHNPCEILTAFAYCQYAKIETT
jgi:hypothetical protein